MDLTSVINMLLPIGFLLAVAALIWFIIELIITVRKTRTVVADVQKQIAPTLDHVEEITASLKPAITKVDPLVERVSLTVDAANLEIMRVDQILEDVKEVTGTISSAAEAIDTAASAPLELVTNVTKKVRDAFRPKHASDESIDLGKVKEARQPEARRHAAHDAVSDPSATTGPIRSQAADEPRPAAASQPVPDPAPAAVPDAAVRPEAPANEAPAEPEIHVETEAPQKQYFTYAQEPVETIGHYAPPSAAASPAPQAVEEPYGSSRQAPPAAPPYYMPEQGSQGAGYIQGQQDPQAFQVPQTVAPTQLPAEHGQQVPPSVPQEHLPYGNGTGEARQ